MVFGIICFLSFNCFKITNLLSNIPTFSPIFFSEFKLFRIWETLVSNNENLDLYGLTVGLTAPQITAIKAGNTIMISEIDASESAKTASKAATSHKDLAIKDGMAPLRKIIRGIKAHTGYTEDIGKALGIIGSEDEVDFLTVKPVLDLIVTPDGVQIGFVLNHCEAIEIYSKRKGDNDFVELKRVMHSPFIDARPKLDPLSAELREYKAYYVMEDELVGIVSDVSSISI